MRRRSTRRAATATRRRPPAPARRHRPAARTPRSPRRSTEEAVMSDARLAGLAESAAQTIERQEWLAPLEDGMQRAIGAAFRARGAAGQAVKNFLHGTWLGHPLHPVLTDLPIGAWTTALVFDTLDAGSRGWPWQQTARRRADDAILVGIVGAVGAALAGLTDWQHTDGQARRTRLAHAA